MAVSEPIFRENILPYCLDHSVNLFKLIGIGINVHYGYVSYLRKVPVLGS